MAAELTLEQRQAFADALYAGRKVEAIKQLRELSGLGLKESKDIIDRLETDLRAQHPERFTTPKNGCSVSVLILAAVLGVLWLVLKR